MVTYKEKLVHQHLWREHQLLVLHLGAAVIDTYIGQTLSIRDILEDTEMQRKVVQDSRTAQACFRGRRSCAMVAGTL